MKEYLSQFKIWYEGRPLREQILTICLALSILYSLFNLILLRPLNNQSDTLTKQIQKTNDELSNWNTQLNALKSIAQTAFYKEWQAQQNLKKNTDNQFKFILQSSPVNHWMDIIKAVLSSQQRLKLLQIQNSPESLYHNDKVSQMPDKIYQQVFKLDVSGNYFDTLAYLKQLEEMLPFIHWDSLSYEVTKYPNANIKMEFSLLYEKNS